MAAPGVNLFSVIFTSRSVYSARQRLLPVMNVWSEFCRTNAHRASITRINRPLYKRMYPVTLVKQDGSTVHIRYHEPRRIIRLPLDLNTLSEEEKLERLALRKPKQTFVIEEEIEDTFDASQYTKYSR